ncbi:hydroxypyruvate isomerase family protein [Desertihabitans aurantiacus]|uniref:hydroxypyruvate isomerase family protein n=1 Tax=Desertihabitans aurantiacus TaxID=2282477 RepID=UPI001E2AF8FA|nr:TIM barrel protein [Desertihabitans aurantiacus]
MVAMERRLSWNGFDVSANLSLLFTELPYRERFAAAAAAGFTLVESWWPFAGPSPDEADVDDLVRLLADSGLRLTGLNFYAGDMPGGERGIACRQERQDELVASTAVLLRIAEATGCRYFNLLHGQLDPSQDLDVQHRTALEAYRRAADAVAEVGGTVLVEPLARGLNGEYPLTTHTEVLALLDEAGVPGLALLVDTFHLGMNGVDLPAAVEAAAGRIGHVQLADVPDRSEPGSGEVPWDAVADALHRAGYDGLVAAEYRPAAGSLDGLGWLRTGSTTGCHHGQHHAPASR